MQAVLIMSASQTSLHFKVLFSYLFDQPGQIESLMVWVSGYGVSTWYQAEGKAMGTEEGKDMVLLHVRTTRDVDEEVA